MSENEAGAPPAQQNNNSSLLQQIEAELAKANREALKAKLKELVKKRTDAEKVVTAINLEITKMISDFEAGLS